VQKLTLGKNVIFCAGRSGSTLFRENADSVIVGNYEFIRSHGLPDYTFNCRLLIRHPIDRYFSGLFFEWSQRIFPHWCDTFLSTGNFSHKPFKENPMPSINLFLRDIMQDYIKPDKEHLGNWLVDLDYEILKKCKIWKFEQIDYLAEEINVEPRIVNDNYFLPFSYSEMYNQLTPENKTYVNDYLRDEIIRYEYIMSTFYNC